MTPSVMSDLCTGVLLGIVFVVIAVILKTLDVPEAAALAAGSTPEGEK